MKQKQKCNQCGRDYWTTMLTIFVFKQRLCSVDKTPMIISTSLDNNKVFTCPKCKKIVTKDNPTELNSLGVKIQGSTRYFMERDKRLAADYTLEFDKVPVPEETICVRCRNYETRAAQATAKREKKEKLGIADDVKEIPKEVSDSDLYKYEINRKLQTDFQERRKAEEYEKQKVERARQEAERKKILEEQMKQPQMPTKEEMEPLIDPETMKIEEEARARDIRIAEYKKNMEEKQKIKEDIAKTDEEITKLKKELEEANKENASS